MLTRLRFQNYRAFAKGEFAIKPITVLVGANSVGKTSILQLPLVLKQTALVSGKDYRSALKIHGREVNIGNPKNLFFNQNISSPIEIVCEFTSTRMLNEFSERYFAEFSDIIIGTIEYYHYALSIANKTKKTISFSSVSGA